MSERGRRREVGGRWEERDGVVVRWWCSGVCGGVCSGIGGRDKVAMVGCQWCSKHGDKLASCSLLTTGCCFGGSRATGHLAAQTRAQRRTTALGVSGGGFTGWLPPPMARDHPASHRDPPVVHPLALRRSLAVCRRHSERPCRGGGDGENRLTRAAPTTGLVGLVLSHGRVSRRCGCRVECGRADTASKRKFEIT